MEKETQKEIRVRIAPSPTGLFHFGTARSALYNYLFARKHGGKFILRIEDTDKERSKKEFADDIIENMKFLGLEYDEGPYYQSKRLKIYQKYLKQLLESGQAFHCYHTKEELEKEKEEQIKRGEGPKHICSHFGMSDKEREQFKGEESIIRFRNPGKKVVFKDLIRGELEFDSGLMGDFSIAKNKETPLYNLAVVIDDYDMKISHVIRGEDHISNTPKQIVLYEALGLPVPTFAHMPMVLGPDRSKMSKRHGNTSFTWYREEGFLPEALNNFMVLLGWNPGTEQEIFSLKELEEIFSLDRVHKGGAVFDIKRLEWINGHYIRQMDTKELAKQCLPYLEKAKLAESKDMAYIEKVVALEQERLKRLSEIAELTEFFFKKELEYSKDLLIWKKMTPEEVKDNLTVLKNTLEKVKEFDQKTLNDLLMPMTEEYGTGNLLWPLRVALTGRKCSPGPFETAEVLGKKESLKRINKAIGILVAYA